MTLPIWKYLEAGPDPLETLLRVDQGERVCFVKMGSVSVKLSPIETKKKKKESSILYYNPVDLLGKNLYESKMLKLYKIN